MRLQAVRALTWAVPDAEASAAAFREWLGYREAGDFVLATDLATALDAPRAAGTRGLALRPASGEAVELRFVQSEPVAGYAPLGTFGWNAAELHVRDAHALARRLEKSPFRIIGQPRDLLGNGAVHAMQVLGPGGELLYLTRIDHAGMRRTYGAAGAAVGRVFIVVLGASDPPRTLAHYAPLARRTARRGEFRITVLARAHGLDPESARFSLDSVVMDGRFRIEVDGYPPTAQPRPRRSRDLPPGLFLVSATVDALDPALDTRTASTGGGRAALLRGPDGEWLELVDPE